MVFPFLFNEKKRKTFSRKQAQAGWDALRRGKEVRAIDADEKHKQVFFTFHPHPYTVAIKYDRKIYLVTEVMQAIGKAYPAVAILDPSTPGVVVAILDSQEEVDEILGGPLIQCNSDLLRAYRTVHSNGSRVKIRVDRINMVSRAEDRMKIINGVFGQFGRIIHTNFHYVQGSTTMRLPSMDFILEIPKSLSKYTKIPRVAQVEGNNILFHWNGPQYCYRCGEESHIKLHCPKPADFDLMTAPETNIFAPAFLSSEPIVKPASSKVTSNVTMDIKATKTSKVTTALPMTVDEWIKVARSKKKKW
ncbi:hypothetical protein EDD11_001874 [Mortierella claussenii]|nr:hypothetical protein EDD11_001874 [Mortierella claussenii]